MFSILGEHAKRHNTPKAKSSMKYKNEFIQNGSCFHIFIYSKKAQHRTWCPFIHLRAANGFLRVFGGLCICKFRFLIACDKCIFRPVLIALSFSVFVKKATPLYHFQCINATARQSTIAAALRGHRVCNIVSQRTCQPINLSGICIFIQIHGLYMHPQQMYMRPMLGVQHTEWLMCAKA